MKAIATRPPAPPDPEDEIIELAAACQFDPAAWADVAFDWGEGELARFKGPRDWQGEVFSTIRDHLANPETRYQPCLIAVSSGHGIGKSAGIGILSNWGMSCWADAKIVITANTLGQLRTKTAPEVGIWFRRSITSHWFDVQSTSIKATERGHEETWRTDFVTWSANNTEAFAGLHNYGRIIIVVYDEASGIDDKVWEVTEGALTDEDTVIIWIAFGNPTNNTGRFRECFRRLRHRWKHFQIDSRTVPGTNKALFERWAEDYGEDSDFFKVRVRGMFPSAGPKQFISTDDVDAAFGRHLREDQFGFAPVILGLDPAWSGDDELVIVKRQGLASWVLATMPKNDNDMQVGAILARLEDEHQADAVFIDAGYGTGIASYGKTVGRSWELVWFGGRPFDPGCMNKRAEIWKEMRDWLKAGASIPKDDVLYQDLIGPETIARPDGKIALEPKEAMKERGQPSPNRADALALTFARPVVKKPRGLYGAGNAASVTDDYNPFA